MNQIFQKRSVNSPFPPKQQKPRLVTYPTEAEHFKNKRSFSTWKGIYDEGEGKLLS